MIPGDALFDAAVAARENAWAPYSGFRVGAAVETVEGTIYAGANVENASYGLTLCAERTALFHAVSSGARRFRRMLVVTDTPALTPPCGACRQAISEFVSGDEEAFQLILANLHGLRVAYSMQELYPNPFNASSLT